MDALKAAVAEKRKAIQEDPIAARPTKYMRRGDIERLKEEQERQAQEEKRLAAEAAEREAKAKASAAQASKVCTASLCVCLHILILKWRTGAFTIAHQLSVPSYTRSRRPVS